MASRPNFTDVALHGGAVHVTGQSDAEPEGDILGIDVVISQGAHSAAASVRNPGGNWNVDVPGEGFSTGPATVAGTETRRENATTITWAQAFEIT
jgi:hypothetical protein